MTQTDNVMRLLLTSMLSLALVAAASAQMPGQPTPSRAEVWDLKLGTPAALMPSGFGEYACGTNGGPPSMPLSGWNDFRRCRPEPSGLREVYFRYDDELEYWAKANELPTEIERYSGTKVYDFPVVLSALFDDGGTLAGLRIVSDPRDNTRSRDEAYALRNFLSARFGREGWSCNDLSAAEGEEPVEGTFIKQDCRKTVDGPAACSHADAIFPQEGPAPVRPILEERNQRRVRKHGALRSRPREISVKARTRTTSSHCPGTCGGLALRYPARQVFVFAILFDDPRDFAVRFGGLLVFRRVMDDLRRGESLRQFFIAGFDLV